MSDEPPKPPPPDPLKNLDLDFKHVSTDTTLDVDIKPLEHEVNIEFTDKF